MAKEKTQSHKGTRQVKKGTYEAKSASSDRLVPYPGGSGRWKFQEKTYHITTEGDRWIVKREGAKRASSIHKTQKEAIEKARIFAKKRSSGRIILHKEDGSIHEEYLNDSETIPLSPRLGKPYSSLHLAHSLNLDGPEDWSARLDYYLYDLEDDESHT